MGYNLGYNKVGQAFEKDKSNTKTITSMTVLHKFFSYPPKGKTNFPLLQFCQ